MNKTGWNPKGFVSSSWVEGGESSWVFTILKQATRVRQWSPLRIAKLEAGAGLEHGEPAKPFQASLTQRPLRIANNPSGAGAYSNGSIVNEARPCETDRTALE